MQTKFLLPAALAALTAGSMASGAIVVSEDFESIAAGTTAAGFPAADAWTGGALADTVVVADASIGGAQLAELSTAGPFEFLNQDAIGSLTPGTDVATLSFDLIIPGGTDGYLRLAAVGSGQNRFSDIATSAFTGTEAIENTVAGDTVVHIDFVAESTAAGVATVYIDGVESSTTGPIGVGTFTRFGLWLNGNGSPATVQFDNVVVRDEAFVVPEPTSLGLLGLGALALAGRRRK